MRNPTQLTRRLSPRRIARAAISSALAVAAVALLATVSSAHPSRDDRDFGTEIIPSLGLTRAVDGDQARAAAGLAVRAPLVRGLLDTEVGVFYRSQEYYGGGLTVRSWPLTGSVWFTPLAPLYVGAGAGWYNTSYRYAPGSPYADETTQKLGLHLGGGVQLPLSRKAALDVSGRYVFLSSESSRLAAGKFNPDSWTTSVGLAFRF